MQLRRQKAIHHCAVPIWIQPCDLYANEVYRRVKCWVARFSAWGNRNLRVWSVGRWFLFNHAIINRNKIISTYMGARMQRVPRYTLNTGRITQCHFDWSRIWIISVGVCRLAVVVGRKQAPSPKCQRRKHGLHFLLSKFTLKCATTSTVIDHQEAPKLLQVDRKIFTMRTR